MSNKSPAMMEFLDKLSLTMGHKQTLSQAIATRTCVACGKPATQFVDHISEREFSISGFCQACQDGLFS